MEQRHADVLAIRFSDFHRLRRPYREQIAVRVWHEHAFCRSSRARGVHDEGDVVRLRCHQHVAHDGLTLKELIEGHRVANRQHVRQLRRHLPRDVNRRPEVWIAAGYLVEGIVQISVEKKRPRLGVTQLMLQETAL